MGMITANDVVCTCADNNEEDCVNASKEGDESRLVLVVVGDEAKRKRANEAPCVRRYGVVYKSFISDGDA